jgi:hypothetical protein
MKLVLPFLLIAFVIMADSCKKSCNYPEYQSGNICYPQIGFKYIGNYFGTDSTTIGSQNLYHAVLVNPQSANSIEITQLAPHAEIDAQGHFVVDTQHIIINQHGFTIFGSGYFIDSSTNEMLVADVYFLSDSVIPSYNLYFKGKR